MSLGRESCFPPVIVISTSETFSSEPQQGGVTFHADKCHTTMTVEESLI
jgi:hypothetical protein